MASLPGLYRALVVDAKDPEHSSRLQVSFPSGVVAGKLWALPCRSPGARSLPKVGATVWVAFESGDSGSPVWVGVCK